VLRKSLMSTPFQIVVCGSIVPDPLQTLEPVTTPTGPGLKNEMMLPSVLDPWAWHSLFEAANLAKNNPGSKVTLVSVAPKAKLQQVMMTVGQKAPFELVAIDGPSSGFTEAAEVAAAIADAIKTLPGLDLNKLLVFGGWESASRGAGATMQIVGELLGITNQFQGVDKLTVGADGSFEILERIEGGKHQVSKCAGAPAVLGWATAEQPTSRHGQHARHHAGIAESQARQAHRRRREVRQRRVAQAATPNQDRQGRARRRNRQGNRRLDPAMTNVTVIPNVVRNLWNHSGRKLEILRCAQNDNGE
jgi:electron transfer flavoprotein beta subunit